MALPISHTSLLALVLCSCANGLSIKGFKAAWYNDCKNQVEYYPQSQPIIEQFAGKDVVIGGVAATNLKCYAGGGRGVIFTAMSNGQEVMVRMIHRQKQLAERDKRDKLYSNFFEQIAANGNATGAQSFTSQISEGFTKEMPEIFAEIWTKAAGQNEIQRQDSGKGPLGFQNPQDFMEFAKQSCEAIMFMWSVGTRHGDIQRANMMWDDQTRVMKLIDYENFKRVHPDGHNTDVKWLSRVLNHYEDDYHNQDGWENVVSMVKDLKENEEEYVSSLSKFKKFYEKHFHSSVTLPSKQ